MLFFDRRIFQFPLNIRNTPICTPNTTAAVDREAAKFSILWFSLVSAAPVPAVFVAEADEVVSDILWLVERYISACMM